MIGSPSLIQPSTTTMPVEPAVPSPDWPKSATTPEGEIRATRIWRSTLELLRLNPAAGAEEDRYRAMIADVEVSVVILFTAQDLMSQQREYKSLVRDGMTRDPVVEHLISKIEPTAPCSFKLGDFRALGPYTREEDEKEKVIRAAWEKFASQDEEVISLYNELQHAQRVVDELEVAASILRAAFERRVN